MIQARQSEAHMKFPSTRDIIHGGPILILAGALGILLLTPVPITNKELVSSIIAGLLGYMTRAPQTPPDQGTH